jgi:hypothetical protein
MSDLENKLSLFSRIRNSTTTKLATLFTAATFAFATCDSGSSSSGKSCADDYDCPGVQLCVQGQCQGEGQSCDDDYDCPGDELCESGVCIGGSSQETKYVQSEKKVTNSSGELEFTLNGENVPVKIKNENGEGLEGITVYLSHKGNKNILVSVDPQGNHFPEATDFNLTSTDNYALTLSEEVEQQQQPLVGIIALIMGVATLGYKIYKEATKTQWGDLLEEGKDVNKYCMTLEQMQNDYIDVPAGLILLAAEKAGYDTEEIKNSVTTPLKEIFEMYIQTKYGTHEGYEVWSPKEAVSLCGGNYDGVVCDITTESLSQNVWNPNGVPVWKINGYCQPKSSCVPQTEVCNGKDDDCDDEIDEGNVCGSDCEPEKSYTSCHNGDVWWFDNCNKHSSIDESCGSNEYCEDGECKLEENTCVDECSSPCLFYDDFCGASLDLKKWGVLEGSNHVSSEKLIMEGYNIISTKADFSSSIGEDYSLTYRGKCDWANGSCSVHIKSLIVSYSFYGNNQILFTCNKENTSIDGGSYNDKWITVKLEKNGDQGALYIDGSLKKSITCSGNPSATNKISLKVSPLNSTGNFQIDHIKLINYKY